MICYTYNIYIYTFSNGESLYLNHYLKLSTSKFDLPEYVCWVFLEFKYYLSLKMKRKDFNNRINNNQVLILIITNKMKMLKKIYTSLLSFKQTNRKSTTSGFLETFTLINSSR